MVNAQEWLDQNYPKCNRKNVTKLDISSTKKQKKNLEGHLDLTDFENLRELKCFRNQLTSLDLSNCSKLEKINCSKNSLTNLDLSGCPKVINLNCSKNKLADLNFLSTLNSETLERLYIAKNNFPPRNLTSFNHLANLKILEPNSNIFFGSLEPLRHLTKLEKLDVSNTNIDGGLEYLPDTIQKFWASTTKINAKSKINSIAQGLKETNEPNEGNNFSPLLQLWEESRPELVKKSTNFAINEKRNASEEDNELETKELLHEKSSIYFLGVEKSIGENREEKSTNNSSRKLKKNQGGFATTEYSELEEKLKNFFSLEPRQKNTEIINNEVLDIEEKISKLTNKLASLEKGNDNAHQFVIVKPNIKKDNHLNCLARLFTGNETCVAVFFDGERLLIASNKKSPKHAKDYIKVLRKFVIDHHDREIYNKLVELALWKIEFNIKNSAAEIDELRTKQSERIFFVLLKKIEEYCRKSGLKKDEIKKITNKPTFDESKLRDIERLFILFNDVKEEEQNFSSENVKLMRSCLCPLHDANTIINAIRSKKFDEKIIRAIRWGKIKYVSGDENTHAEMKMINEIYSDGEGGYIGLTKLTCAPCWMMINLLNDNLSANPFVVCGTHGGTYHNWKVPNIDRTCKLELFKRLKNLLTSEVVIYRKGHESTKKYRFSRDSYEPIYKDSLPPEKIPKLKIEIVMEEIVLKSRTRLRKRLKEIRKIEIKTEKATERKILKQKQRERWVEREEKLQTQIQISPKQR